jgi:hypothetical protein
MQRPDGFYWVKFEGRWIVAEWERGWRLPGKPYPFDDNMLQTIGKQIFGEDLDD